MRAHRELRGRSQYSYAAIACFGLLVGCNGGASDGEGPKRAGPDEAGEDDGADGPDGDPSDACGGAVGVSPLRRLTRTQYNNTIRDLLGVEGDPAADLTPDERIGTFFSNATAPVGELRAEEFMRVAEGVAEIAVADLEAIVPCDPAVDDQATCGAEFVDAFGQRAFRRPLSSEERDALLGLLEKGRTEVDFSEGVRLVIGAALQSPQFLYHVEVEVADGADGVAALGQYEVASRLSYFLWDSMPDDELLRAAGDGELDTADALRAQAERMIDDPRAADTIATFHLQWLGIDGLSGVQKDPAAYPSFDAQLREAMTEETTRFADWVIRSDDGRLETLMTATYSFIDGPLFELYGVTPPADHDPSEPIELDPTQRAGLLTHAGVLATHAHANQSSPIERGKLVRENLLCQELAPPPPEVDPTPPPPDPDATTRERFDQHRADPTCAACHDLIDPIGFGFEHYDAIGAWRATDAGKPVDATGEVSSTIDIDGPFDGAPELAQMLGSSEQVQACVVRQWLSFALGRPHSNDDACAYDVLVAEFDASDHDIRELMVAIVTTDSFRFRRLQEAGQ